MKLDEMRCSFLKIEAISLKIIPTKFLFRYAVETHTVRK